MNSDLIRALGLSLSVTSLVGVAIAAGQPRPIAQVDIPYLSADVQDVTVVFLSDESLDLLLLPLPRYRNAKSFVIRYRITGSEMAQLGVAAAYGQDIWASSEGRVLLRYGSRLTLYAADMTRAWNLPLDAGEIGQFMSTPAPLSQVVGHLDGTGWQVFHLTTPPAVISQGTGDLLATSDRPFLVRRDNVLYVQAMEGDTLGSVRVPSGATARTPPGMKPDHRRIAEFAGSQRVLLSFGEQDRIVDFAGKLIAALKPPPGFGFRHGWSRRGRRVLYDHYQIPYERTIQLVEHMFSPLVAPAPANGEEITVFDALTGSRRFHLRQFNQKAPMWVMHADISPSGRLAAVVANGKLCLYNLPPVPGDE